ncbi:MAG TPA: DoxX family protein [Nocardioidaceae bacterium]|nr:DoxX family protein [Nocardioidaceae bacterium]
MSVGKLTARVLIGGLFFGHGMQKWTGWFGGPGLQGTDGMMASLDMHPPRRNSIASSAVESIGGPLLAVGLGTPLASAALIGNMVVAIRKVHLANGPWNANGGWEFNAVLIAALALLAEQGPGPVSLDATLGLERTGPAWGLGALALGTAAALGAIEAGRRAAPAVSLAAETPLPQTAGDPVTAD